MTCLASGRPTVAQRAARAKLIDESASSADPIAILWTCPYECVVEGWYFTVDAVPLTSEVAALSRDSVDGANYDSLIRAVNPADDGETDYACNNEWRFAEGDAIKFDYPNSDDNTVNVTIFVRQVDN